MFQAAALPGDGGDWWALVEPNGLRARDEGVLKTLMAGAPAASFFWNVNSVMWLMRMQDGTVLTAFDPLLDDEHGEHPGASALALIEDWTAVTVTREWFESGKPTFVVDMIRA